MTMTRAQYEAEWAKARKPMTRAQYEAEWAKAGKQAPVPPVQQTITTQDMAPPVPAVANTGDTISPQVPAPAGPIERAAANVAQKYVNAKNTVDAAMSVIGGAALDVYAPGVLHPEQQRSIPVVQPAAEGVAQAVRDTTSLAARLAGASFLADQINRASNEVESAASQKFVPRTVRGVTRSLTSMIPAAAVAGPYGAIVNAAAQQGNQSLTERPGDYGYAARQAALEGGIAAAFQAVGLGGAEKVIGNMVKGGVTQAAKDAAKQGFRNTAKTIAKELGSELTEEELTTWGQLLDTKLTNGEPVEIKDFIQPTIDTAAQTALTMGLVESPDLARAATEPRFKNPVVPGTPVNAEVANPDSPLRATWISRGGKEVSGDLIGQDGDRYIVRIDGQQGTSRVPADRVVLARQEPPGPVADVPKPPRLYNERLALESALSKKRAAGDMADLTTNEARAALGIHNREQTKAIMRQSGFLSREPMDGITNTETPSLPPEKAPETPTEPTIAPKAEPTPPETPAAPPEPIVAPPEPRIVRQVTRDGIEKAFPGARIEPQDDGSYIVTVANGAKIHVREARPVLDRTNFNAVQRFLTSVEEHALTPEERTSSGWDNMSNGQKLAWVDANGIDVAGSSVTFDGKTHNVDSLIKAVRDGELPHESMHAWIKLAATDAQYKSFMKYYGTPEGGLNEEAVVRGYLSTIGKDFKNMTGAEKIVQKIKEKLGDFAAKLTGRADLRDAYKAFRDVRWNQPLVTPEERTARGASPAPEPTIKETVNGQVQEGRGQEEVVQPEPGAAVSVAPPAPTPQPTPEKFPATSIKNADVDELRAQRGASEIEHGGDGSWPKWINEANQKLASDPEAGTRLVNELSRKSRNVSPQESALLTVHHRRAYSEYERLSDELFKANESGDSVRTAELQSAVREQDGIINGIEDVADKTGTLSGQSLNARKIVLYNDMSFAGLVRKARVAQGGEKLSSEQMTELRGLADKIKDAEARLAAEQSKNDELQRKLELAHEEQKSVLNVDKVSNRKRFEIVKERNEALGEFKRKMRGKVSMPTGNTMGVGETTKDFNGMPPGFWTKKKGPGILSWDQWLQQAESHGVYSGPQTIEGFVDFLRTKSVSVKKIDLELGTVHQIERAKETEPINAAEMRDGSLVFKDGEWHKVSSDEDGIVLKDGGEINVNFQQTIHASGIIKPGESGYAAAMDAFNRQEHGKGAPKLETPNETPRLKMSPGAEFLIAKHGTREAAADELARQIVANERNGEPATPENKALLDELRGANKNAQSDMFAETEDPFSQGDVNELFSVERPKDKDALKEERARRRYEAYLTKRIKEQKDILAKGDFAPRPKKEPRPLSPNELRLKKELEDLKGQVIEKMGQYHFEHLSPLGKTADLARETMHLSRALMTSVDLSATLRQGAIAVFAHPFLARKNAIEMTKALVSKQAHFNSAEAIRNDPLGHFAEMSGLSITSDSGKITRQEEAYMGRWAKKVPGVAASGRAYTTFLNNMRFDLFKQMVNNLGIKGQVTLDEAKVIATYINVATGRADFKAMNRAAANLNTVFFAPRYVASRFQYLAMPGYLPFTKNSARVKTMIAKEYARTFVGAASFIGSLMAFGYLMADDKKDEPTFETDPRSADFLKVKIGDTRIDPTAGISSAIVLSARMITGQTKNAKGKVKDFGEGYKPTTRATTMAQFLRTKLAPIPGAAVTAASDFTDPVGEKQTPLSVAERLFVPLSIGDVADAMKDKNIPTGVALSTLALLGAGCSTYGPRTEYLAATPEEREKIFMRDLRSVEGYDPPLAYAEYLTPMQIRKFDHARTLARNREKSKAIKTAPSSTTRP